MAGESPYRPGGGIPTATNTDPELVRPLRRERALHQVVRPVRQLGRNCRRAAPAAHDTSKPQVVHQPGHRAAGDGISLSVELTPDLASAVDPEVLLPDPLDLRP